MQSFSALTVLVLAAVASASPVKRAAAPTDTQILQYALTLENLENNFYAGALAKFDNDAFVADGLPVWARGRFEELASHEAAHVAFLKTALGADAVAPCNYTLCVYIYIFDRGPH